MFQNIGDEEVIKSVLLRPAVSESVKAVTAKFTGGRIDY